MQQTCCILSFLVALSGQREKPMRRSRVDEEVASFLKGLLDECGGNCAVVAARLGVNRSTIWRCVKRGGGVNKPTRDKISAYRAHQAAAAQKGSDPAAVRDKMQQSATGGEDIAAARRMLQTLLGALDVLELTR
jgi:hypothetical protein